MKTILRHVLAVGAVICFVVIIFFTSIQVIALNIGYYEREYRKHNIYESISVSPENLRSVTEHMLDYLKGKKPDLVVYTNVAGEEREFFNEKEKFHMVDVAGLFTNGYKIRNTVLFLLAIFFGALLVCGEWIHPFFKSLQILSGTVLVIMGVAAALIFTNFSHYFTLFHEVFFDNELWLLDPNTDLLLNIVPEGFFIDTAIYVTAIFVSSMMACCLVSTIVLIKRKKGI